MKMVVFDDHLRPCYIVICNLEGSENQESPYGDYPAVNLLANHEIFQVPSQPAAPVVMTSLKNRWYSPEDSFELSKHD